MTVWEIILIGAALAMDAVAVGMQSEAEVHALRITSGTGQRHRPNTMPISMEKPTPIRMAGTLMATGIPAVCEIT